MLTKEYRGVASINGPLVVVDGVTDVGFDEMVEVITPDKHKRRGRVLQVSKNRAVIQVFEGTSGLATETTRVKFLRHPMEIALSRDILGRVFNGVGEPIDGGGEVYSNKKYNINGNAINPYSRQYPRNYIQTGVSAIDGLITLIRGQKLPIFSGNGLPHNQLAAQIARQARLGDDNEDFAVVFVAMGIKHDDANFFINSFEKSGVLQNVVVFLNLADDPAVERIIAPRIGLTAAEYLAFEEGMHILVIMTDMTNYCEALRELSSRREEVPSRKGYPGYLYSDLASLYERAGMIKGERGSITQLPILTMPNDDITHPVPDLTGYITEGQIVLKRDLYQRGVYPPINILPSLSRLMKDGIGEGFTREDHPNVSSQLYAAYSRVQEVKSLASVIGEDELSSLDQTYLKFGRVFEKRFLSQGREENRTIEQTLDLAWEVLSELPPTELDRISGEELEKYYRGSVNDNG
ncbi:V-type ATP synthase subunit B [Halothermothrix orenii]|uniref:V-type ATP synthase beta chain n=1 Tax=Halothermothrix orenii (strain H 168 / OCM 544 / DSM 9562) TaxID=373903 RepID=VATB_HALOH|nr:RecName: Full=V-type ATP synthase beta chain; AltName: Full=V-ATPase subunit B [Halothermothrix orenii H 168]ACL70686.1 V-type ATP synthase subunit B [Halothermothrix orenii H 168]